MSKVSEEIELFKAKFDGIRPLMDLAKNGTKDSDVLDGLVSYLMGHS